MKLKTSLFLLFLITGFAGFAQQSATPQETYILDKNKTIALTNGVFFDDGGEKGNVSNKPVTATFSSKEGVLELYFTEFNIPYDASFRIYEGTSVNGRLLADIKASDKPWNFKAKDITVQFIPSKTNAAGRGWRGVLKQSNISKLPTVQSAPESDCPFAIPLCANNTVLVSASQYVDLGSINDDNGSCYSGTGSGGSVWYSFTPQTTGPLDFLIIPSGSTDYDFVLWDITGGCGSKTQILCNYSATHGNTGAASSGASASEGSSGSLLCTRPTVTVGRQYALCINFYGGSNDGFTLRFKNETSSVAITDNIPPTITYVTGNGCTNTTVMDVYFSEWINCTTLQASDFTMPGHTFTMINDFCNGGKTNHVQIGVSPALTAVAGTPSSYTLSVLNTGPGTSMNDMCGNPMNVNYVVTLGVAPVANAGPDKYNCKSPGLFGIGYNYSSVTLNGSGGAPGSLYNWSDGSTGQSPSVSPTSTTNYTLTVTQGACTATDVVTVFTETAPIVNLGPDILMCSGLPLTLNASGGGTYQWQVQSGTVIFFGTPTFSTIPGASGSSYSTTPVQYGSTGSTYYQVNVTSPNGGCTVSDQIKITFGSGSFGILSSKPFLCAGETTTLSLPTGMNAYTWNTGTSPNAPLVVTPGTTTSYTATSTTAGCTGTAVVTVPVRALPVVIASASPSVICAGNTATLSAAPTGSAATTTEDFETANSFTLVNGSNNKWYWGTAAFAGGTKGLYIGTAATNNNYDIGNFISPKTATNHAYKDYVINSFCTSDLSFKWKSNGQAGQAELTVWLVPNTFVPVAGTAITASGSNVLLGGPYNGQTTYQNVTLNLAPYAGQTARIVFQWVNTGSAIIGGPVVANPAASIDDVVFSESLTYSYNWSSSPGGLGATSSSLTVSPSVVTAYSVTVTRCDGCSNAGSVPLSVLPAATALTVSPTSTICPGQTITLTASGGGSYTWTPTAGITGSNTSATISVNPSSTTVYTVTSPNCNGTQTSTVEVVVNGNLSVSAAPVSASVCPGSTITLTAGGATSYTWSPVGSLSSANGTTVSASPAVTTTYTVVGSNAAGCQGTNTLVVNVDAIPSTTASASGSITCATNTVNLTSTLAGMTYTWTAPAGSSVTSGANTQNAVANGAGTYTLMVVNPAGGCSYSTTATVTSDLSAPLGVSAGTSQTLSCSSTSVTLNGTYTSPAGSTVAWLGGVCGAANSLTTSACAAGVYTLSVQNPATGCSATSTVQIFPNAGAPSLTLTPVSNSITCTNTLVSVSITSTTTPITINWTGPGIIGSTTGTTIDVNQGGVYTVTLTNTSSLCTTVFNVTVPSNTTVVTPSITGGLNISCNAPSTLLTASPTGSAYTYTWTGAGITTPANSASVNVNAGGNYTVSVTDATTGCSGTAVVTVTASGVIPTATIVATSSNSIITCANATVGLTVNSTPSTGMSYSWSTGSTGQTLTQSTPGVVTVTVQNTASGCYTTAQYTINSNTTPPVITSANATIPCGSPSVALLAGSTTPNVTYQWTTSGTGVILSGATTASPIVGATGQYIVTVTDNGNGCSSTQTVNVTSSGMTAAFTADPLSGMAPLLVNFTNQSPGTGNIYHWNFGDSLSTTNTSSLTNPDHTYHANGTYTVTLTVTDASGLCSATATVVIHVLENSSIIVPNVFTPNGDGKNDVFKITTVGIKDLQCDIFNRWGTKMASITSPSGYWDGSNASDGAYFYILNCTGYDGKEYKQQGYLQLFK